MKIKIKKDKDKEGTIKFLWITIIILSITVGMYAVYIFMNGYHNLDLGQNIRVINAYQGNNFTDVSSTNAVYTGTELYTLGVNQIMVALPLFGISAFLIGVSLANLVKEEK